MFFKKKEIEKNNLYLVKIGALLIHAAKIDQNLSKIEEKIIEKTLIELGANQKQLNTLINASKIAEENSNQILEFTKEIKQMHENKKIKIIESLWRIVYSDKDADIYETNLMRRLSGLLYVDSKIMGKIKEKIKQENS